MDKSGDSVKRLADLGEVLADHILSAEYERLGEDAIDIAKKSILDTIGVSLAATGLEPSAQPFVQLALESGGASQSTILGYPGKVPALMAAFANGALAHGLDFDDRTQWGQHSASSLVPALLALAETSHRVSGRDLICATAVGQDLFNRLRLHIDWKKDWNFSSVAGLICAVAAGARLMRLNRDGITAAFGIASMEAGGTTEIVGAPGGNLRGVYAAFPARGAVTAVLLGQKGLRGVPTIFEGTHGILRMFFGDRYNREGIVSGLGTTYLGPHTIYKPWPVVGIAQSHLVAAIRLATEHDLAPGAIAHVRLFVGDYHRLMCSPLEARQKPSTMMDARFSLPFIVGVALARRDVRLADFQPEALKDPVVLDLTSKVIPVDEDGRDWNLEVPTGRVEIETVDGRRFEATGTNIPGNPQSPLSWDDIVGKFADCASSAATPMRPEHIDGTAKAIRQLELLDRASSLMSHLSITDAAVS